MARQSMRMRVAGMPCSAAAWTMRSAMAKRPSAVVGMPSSSSVSPMTFAPYRAAMGRISSSTSRLPLTELMMGLPA